ncbi:MAG: glycosyltransferase [Actinomycetota bacterium]|nr:glycosyltransferase [Actinomycetota bacterium]
MIPGNAAWPSVGVVIATRDRPEQLRRALAAVLGQDYRGRMEVVVVFDGCEPERSLRSGQVRTTENVRTPGLAGARNTGILSTDHELVAFCDDDDEWLPGKLDAQVRSLLATGADFVTAGVVIAYDGKTTVRLAGTSAVTHEQLLRSRMSMLHSSTFVIRRRALLRTIGLVDESIPGAQGEDWDLLLRAARQRPIVHVDEPLTRVSWNAGSYFGRRWDTKAASLRWVLDRHPEVAADGRAAARVYGQIAFAHAALGQPREALRWSAKAIARYPLQPRGYIAAAVALRLVTSEQVVDALHRRGRGV